MPGKLKDEIKKRHGFESLEQEAFLNLLRTGEFLMGQVEGLLKGFGLSGTQYNVLRILRGGGARCPESGLACGEVAGRMVTRDPDVTRLMDRLEERGLITRARGAKDRRVVRAAITEEGLRLLKELDDPVRKLHKRQLEHLGGRRLKEFIKVLEEVRGVGTTDRGAGSGDNG